jgi:hypothetical protein
MAYVFVFETEHYYNGATQKYTRSLCTRAFNERNPAFAALISSAFRLHVTGITGTALCGTGVGG